MRVFSYTWTRATCYAGHGGAFEGLTRGCIIVVNVRHEHFEQLKPKMGSPEVEGNVWTLIRCFRYGNKSRPRHGERFGLRWTGNGGRPAGLIKG